MALAELRAAWATILQGIAAVGVVNAFEPYASTVEEFAAHFKPGSGAAIDAWSITRESTAEVPSAMRANLAVHTFVFRFYRSVGQAGATETAFQDYVETVRARMRQEQVGRLSGQATEVGPPQARAVKALEVGDALFHYAELVVVCSETVTY